MLEARLEEQHGRDAADVVAGLVDRAVDLAGGGKLASGSVELPAGSDAGAFGDLLRERIVGLDRVSPDAASRATGSGGGGRPHLARGGVGDAAPIDAAVAAAVNRALEIAGTPDTP